MSSQSTSRNTKLLAAGLAAAFAVSYLMYLQSRPPANAESKDDNDESAKKAEKTVVETISEEKQTTAPKKYSETPKRSNVTPDEKIKKQLHLRIEELDKKGKALFKSRKVRVFCDIVQRFDVFFHVCSLLSFVTAIDVFKTWISCRFSHFSLPIDCRTAGFSFGTLYFHLTSP